MPQNSAEQDPTLNVTQAYETVAVRLTEAVQRQQTATPSSAPPTPHDTTPSPTQPPEFTATAALAQPTATRLACDLAAAGNPIDVSIPDDTQMRPGQTFTKTWRLQNVGGCAWTNDYTVELFSGEAMGAPASLPLPRNVNTGQTVDISIDMVAPQSPGTYQGNWKLRNASDQWFGIGPNGSAPFWVRIVVVQSQTSTPTTPAQTATSTLTATPEVHSNGLVNLQVQDKVDLDSRGVNAGGEEFSYETSAEGYHVLIPQGSAVMGVYGANQPNYQECKSATLSNQGLVAEFLSPGTYLCYRTDQGRTGRALFLNLGADDFSLSLDIVTWVTR